MKNISTRVKCKNYHKKFLCLALVFLLSINSFATSIGDNNGSAFITKAEFDSLKNNFQSQLDAYNTGIDSKIDTAIASYLTGIKISPIMTKDILIPLAVETGVYGFTNKVDTLKYKTCLPISEMVTYRSDVQVYNGNMSGHPLYDQPRNGVYGCYKISFGPPSDTSKNKGDKTVITKLDTTAKIAAWKGFCQNCFDTIRGTKVMFQDTWNTTYVGSYTADFAIQVSDKWTDTPIIENKNSPITNRQWPSGGICVNPWIESIIHDWGTEKYPLISCQYDFIYDLFSNYDRDYNWSYPNACDNKFLFPGTSSDYIKTETVTFPQGSYWADFSEESNIYQAWNIVTGENMSAQGWYVKPVMGSAIAPAGKQYNWEQEYTGYKWTSKAYNNVNYQTAGRTTTYYPPFVGFETEYLTKWGQIYIDAYDSIFADPLISSSTVDSILTGSDGTKHLSCAGGFPLLKINSGEDMIEYKFHFDDPNAQYAVYFNDGPFHKNLPWQSDKLITNLTGYQMNGNTKVPISLGSGTGFTKAYIVSGKETTINIPKADDDRIIFVKWLRMNGANITTAGGGIFYPNSTYKVKFETT